MDEKELREAYLEAIKFKTNNSFESGVPKAVELAIEMLIKESNSNSNVQSKSIPDLKITYKEYEDWPTHIKSLIKPFNKVKCL